MLATGRRIKTPEKEQKKEKEFSFWKVILRTYRIQSQIETICFTLCQKKKA